MKVKPSELSLLLEHAFEACLPVLITGDPGVGKSVVVGQAAAKVKRHLFITHPVVEDASDAKGIPWPDKKNGHANFLLGGVLAQIIQCKEPAVWCMDDLGQALPSTQAANMQWLLARQCSGHRLPDNVTIVACTNHRKAHMGVTGMLEPVKSRFATIVELVPDLDDWIGWAIDHKMPAELIAFLRFRPELLLDSQPTADMVNSPSPRTWEAVGQWMRKKLPPVLEYPTYAGAVGEAAASEVLAFLKMYRELPDPRTVLTSPDKVEIPTGVSALFALCTAVAALATADNFSAIARFSERLMREKSEYAVLLWRDAYRRQPEIGQTKAFQKLATSELGRLVVGRSDMKTVDSKSLATRALLVDLDITQWHPDKVDPAVSEEVATKHSAESAAAGQYVKRILAPNAAHKAVRRMSSHVRGLHYGLTLPWGTRDQRIILSAQYLEYSDMMAKAMKEFDATVHEFVKQYPLLKGKAKKFLGSLYREDDYPTAEAIRAAFSMHIRVLPVPTGGDFRVKLSTKEITQMRKQLEHEIQGNLQSAMHDLWQQAYQVVAHLAERLTDSDAVLRDSVVEKVRELCARLPRLNLTQDPKLEDVRKEILKKLTRHDGGALREDESLRSEIGKQAEAIVKRMSAYMEAPK